MLLNKLLFCLFFLMEMEAFAALCLAALGVSAQCTVQSKYWLCDAVSAGQSLFSSVTVSQSHSAVAAPHLCWGRHLPEGPPPPGACPHRSVAVGTVCLWNNEYFLCLRL